MSERERKDVFKVYDIIGERFFENRSQNLMEEQYLELICSLIPNQGNILDLGCGSGKPIFEYFKNRGYQVVGVDASEKILSIARENFPEDEFFLMNMRQLKLEQKFDAIIAWHSLFHLEGKDQEKMFKIFQEQLKPNGVLMFTSGNELAEAWSENYGQDLFHASLSPDQYQELLTAHQFKLIQHSIEDPECGGATVWIAQLVH
ncbi:class I SAM-dependent DNA methyltransferase [Sphingobacterium mizutaii]|uniref:class I SAM-dependent DNA methyltransferase n=1 Tax=Sphingobacterium mizutaii TaxID=1010 RepID=UPI0028ACA46E|nr:class I SAM-dependent methyltransferase [Sphingobacterium mizutaii]